jgi:hypothetical protein
MAFMGDSAFSMQHTHGAEQPMFAHAAQNSKHGLSKSESESDRDPLLSPFQVPAIHRGGPTAVYAIQMDRHRRVAPRRRWSLLHEGGLRVGAGLGGPDSDSPGGPASDSPGGPDLVSLGGPDSDSLGGPNSDSLARRDQPVEREWEGGRGEGGETEKKENQNSNLR